MHSIFPQFPHQHYHIIPLQQKRSQARSDGAKRNVLNSGARLEARWASAGSRGCSSGAVGSRDARVAAGELEVGTGQTRGVGAVDDNGAVPEEDARARGGRGVEFEEPENSQYISKRHRR